MIYQATRRETTAERQARTQFAILPQKDGVFVIYCLFCNTGHDDVYGAVDAGLEMEKFIDAHADCTPDGPSPAVRALARGEGR